MLLEQISMRGKTAIVTGAGRGLGKEMALALADAGADVACAARTQEQIKGTAEEIRARDRRALAVPTDVTRSADVDTLVQHTLDAWGRVDVLIANAGGGGSASLKDVIDINDADWDDALALNLSSAFYCARAVVPHFRERGGGVIITVASTAGLRGEPRLLAYGAAKAAVAALTRSLAAQLAADNIRVNCIVPGFVLQRPIRDQADIRAARSRGASIPARRLGEAWELGPLAVYLASAASSYVTGQAFVIDGGAMAGGLTPGDWDLTTAGSAPGF